MGMPNLAAMQEYLQNNPEVMAEYSAKPNDEFNDAGSLDVKQNV